MRRAAAALGLIIAVVAALADDSADLRSLHALILPQQGELTWTSLPWTTDLWEARKVACENGKPIFLWEMDGHPLGCT